MQTSARTSILIGIIAFFLGIAGLFFYERMTVRPIVPVSQNEGMETPKMPTVSDTDTSEVPVVAGPGTYAVYMTTSITDQGPKDWGNDDTLTTNLWWYRMEDGTSHQFGTTDRTGTDGSVIVYPFGPDVLAHRWTKTIGDAVLAMDGTVVEQGSNEDWARMRSKDGSIEVTWGNPETEAVSWMIVKRNGVEVAKTRIDHEAMGTQGPSSVSPDLVSDDDRHVYLTLGPWEGPGTFTIWRFDIDDGSLHPITYLQDHGLYQYSINPATNQLIGVSAALVPVFEGIGDTGPGAPSAIHLVDLLNDTGRVIREDDSFYLNNVFLSPDGTQFAYHNNDDDALWIDTVAEGEIKPNNHPVSGTILAWDTHGMVIDRDGELIVYDPMKDTATVLDRTQGNYWDPDYQRVNFVGVITLN